MDKNTFAFSKHVHPLAFTRNVVNRRCDVCSDTTLVRLLHSTTNKQIMFVDCRVLSAL
jgi:hypothetical protein